MQNEQDDEILLTVTVDEGATEARIKAINAQIKFLRDAAKGLAKDLKDGAISQQQYDQALGRANDQLGRLTKELTTQKKALDDNRKGIVANTGSLNEMQARASAAKAEYLALTKAERDNDKVGGDLLKRVQDLNKEYDEQNKKLTTSRRTLVDYVRDLEPFGVNIGKTYDAFRESGQSVVGFVKGLGSIKNAIAATGIGLLLLALGALYTYLTKTQAGMDFLARKTAGISAVFQKLTSFAISMGETIFKAFEEGRAGAALLDVVVENVTNRLKGLKVIAEGIINLDWRRIADGFVQVGTGITDATTKAEALATGLNKTRIAAEAITLESQKIRDAEIKLNVERAKGRAEIEKLKKVSEDTTKSTQERANAAQRAYSLENNLLQQSISLQKRKIENLKAEKQQGQATAESRQAIAEEEIKLSELVEESTGKQTELQNNLNSIRKEGADNALAAQKKAADETIAYWERALIQAKRNQQDTVEIEEQLIRLRAKAALIDTSSTDKKGAQERLLILAQAEAEILELRTNKAIEIAARLTSIKQSEIKALLAVVKEGTLAELELNKALVREEGEQQKQQAKATIKNQEELAAKIKEIDATTKKALLEADKAFAVKQVEIALQRAEREQKITDTLMGRFRADQAKRASAEQSHAQTLLQIAKAGTKEELNAKINAINVEQKEAIAAANGNAEEIIEINKRADDAIAKAKAEFYSSQVQRVLDVASQAAGVLQNLLTAQSQAAYAAFDKQSQAALASAGANADLRARLEEQLAKKKLKLDKEIARKQQKIASIQNIIATAQAVTKAFVEGGPIFGPILAAISLANGVAQQAIIDSQQFAKGGVATYVSDGQGAYIRGPGTSQSDSINARISNGESILTAKATDMFYDQLSAMNVAGGGRAFPGAGGEQVPQVTSFAFGGVNQTNNSAELAVAVVQGLKAANITVAVTDIQKVSADLAYAVASGNV